jgi:DNA-binding protein YbaB
MKRLKFLEDENTKLRKIVADLSLDREMLQDVIVAAVNEALRAAQELANQRLGAVTGGLSGLGLPGF